MMYCLSCCSTKHQKRIINAWIWINNIAYILPSNIKACKVYPTLFPSPNFLSQLGELRWSNYMEGVIRSVYQSHFIKLVPAGILYIHKSTHAHMHYKQSKALDCVSFGKSNSVKELMEVSVSILPGAECQFCFVPGPVILHLSQVQKHSHQGITHLRKSLDVYIVSLPYQRALWSWRSKTTNKLLLTVGKQ